MLALLRTQYMGKNSLSVFYDEEQGTQQLRNRRSNSSRKVGGMKPVSRKVGTTSESQLRQKTKNSKRK
jgi:hypothetical protein